MEEVTENIELVDEIMSIESALNLIISDDLIFPEFEWRYGQRDIVKFVVERWLDDDDIPIIIEAPTGSGKSILIMASIICYRLILGKKSSYVLTPEIMLQKQYQEDIDRIKSLNSDGAILLGASNYTCSENGQPYTNGVCTLTKMTAEERDSMPCAKTCTYLKARFTASKRPITVMNYHNWLLYQNKVNSVVDPKKQRFPMREIACFDEAHKIENIIQSVFSTKINVNRLTYSMRYIIEMLTKYESQYYIDYSADDIISLSAEILPIAENIINNTSRIDGNYTTKNYHNLIDLLINEDSYSVSSFMNTEAIINTIDRISSNFDTKVGQVSVIDAVNDAANDTEKKTPIPDDLKEFLKACDYLNEITKEIYDFVDGLMTTGQENLVFDVSKEMNQMSNELETFVELRNSDASGLCERYLHPHYKFGLFTSATFGSSIDVYAKSIGLSTYYPIRLPSIWTYEKSPIIQYTGVSLSRKNLTKNLPIMISLLDQIVNSEVHKNQRGIIHTGNYSIMEYIINNTNHRDRFLPYRGTKDKLSKLEELAEGTNKIIIGPSLTEGLNLNDDLARFMILVKTPYPYLGDSLVKAKSDKNPLWYDWTTSTIVQQMLGRPIRNEKDWCVTYAIDTSLRKFLFGVSVPNHISMRYKPVIYL